MTLKIKCTECGGETRLVGIEPHHKASGVDVWTLECTGCGHIDIQMPQNGAASPVAEARTG